MKYQIMRQDDNANISAVPPPYPTRKEAEERKHQLEYGKLGYKHKQDYWIEVILEPENSVTTPESKNSP